MVNLSMKGLYDDWTKVILNMLIKLYSKSIISYFLVFFPLPPTCTSSVNTFLGFAFMFATESLLRIVGQRHYESHFQVYCLRKVG